METPLTPLLDRIEDSLPEVPRRVFKLNRAVTVAGLDVLATTAKAFCGASRRSSDRASTGASTVIGQAASVADRVETTTRNGAKEIVGQARAQAKATLEVVEEEALDLLDAAEDLIDDLPAVQDDRPEAQYESQTKAELYERAQELDISGRSSMSKTELIAALRAIN